MWIEGALIVRRPAPLLTMAGIAGFDQSGSVGFAIMQSDRGWMYLAYASVQWLFWR
ncbi:MAG: hypothetical protein H6937_09700 [Burkholderiales bacterium]|nr:hypothetical protein [Burkholderiales bacterium]